MKIELETLCEALKQTFLDGAGDLDYLVGYLLYDAHPELDALIDTYNDVERLDRIAEWAQGKAATQAFQKACDGSRASSRAGKGRARQQPRTVTALADSRPDERVRAVVEVTGRGTLDQRPVAEVRALELLREGASERSLLAILKQERLRLDKSKLKRLRAEANATTT
jgi:hypothetical protein